MTASRAHADLPGLLRGELGNAEVADAGTHVRACRLCNDRLVETVIGHALLTRSAAALARRRRQVPRLRVLGVAVAITGAACAGAWGHAWLVDRDAPDPDRSASLLAVSGGGGGTVSMRESRGRTSMTIDTHDLPAAGDGQFYYAWLLQPGTNKMLPLGQVGPSGSASFEVSDALLAAYSAVDVSLEDDDGDPQHSPTSVLRATYA